MVHPGVEFIADLALEPFEIVGRMGDVLALLGLDHRVAIPRRSS
jgi:hypothetical protein